MKNLFTFIVALFMATSVYAQTMWKASADVNPIPANTELINDGGLVVKTVFGNTLAAKEDATIDGEKFSAYFQVRTGTDPTEDNPECTEESGKKSTSLIVEVAGKTTFTIYGRRQVLNGGCVNNDGKDLLMVNQNNVKELLTPTDYSWSFMPDTKEVYAYYKKTYTLNPGTYTIFRRGSTMKIYGIKYAFESESSSVTITSAGFATHASKFAVDYSNRPDGLVAYAVKYADGKLTYNKINGIVPANTAVLLSGDAKEYTLTAAKGETTTVDTDLKVADGKTKGDGNIYCLANKSYGVGFYRVETGVQIPANKAYLKIGTPTTTPAKYYSIGIGGNTTGIQAIQQNSVKADGIMYSLSGQRVGKDYKGIVICNGKKMIKK